jgi:hypothetical protein
MKILFIGNSHTFYNAMPFQVRHLVRGAGIGCDVCIVANGGMTLGWHAEQPSTIADILYGEFSHIVLQQKSHPFDGAEALLADLALLEPSLAKSGARTFLCNSWPEKDKPENRPIIDAAIRNASRTLGFGILPVSDVWFNVLAENPVLELYDIDREHASPLGSYLAAAAIACTLAPVNPSTLPARIEVESTVLADVGMENAGLVGKAVEKALREKRT